MSHPAGGTARARPGLAAALCLVLMLTGAALAVAADSPPLDLGLPVPSATLALLLLSAYLFAGRVTLDFEVRGDAHSVTLGQLPLALGVLLVAPQAHLAAYLTATALVAAWRRQTSLKWIYNISAASFEVGTAAFAVSLVAADGQITHMLWPALLAGLLVADLVTGLALGLVWRLLGMPQLMSRVVPPLMVSLAASAVAAGLTLITVTAAVTEPASILLILLFAAGLASIYRRHRRLQQQQQTTQDLYAFVRALGPVDAEDDGALAVLEQVRLLLHAKELELLTATRAGGWQRLVTAEDAEAVRQPAEAPSAAGLTVPVPGNDLPSRVDAGLKFLSTPLLGTAGLVGLMTARGRLGEARDFDLGDVQLLDTLGSELATALERGHLLADLQRTATTDPLTGLPNLSETARLLDEALATGNRRLVLAALTVESFREVNDTLGHEFGDALLLETAARLRRSHPQALIGRIGGGRFTVAIPAVQDEMSAHLFGLGIRALVEGGTTVSRVGTDIRLSVGVAQAPDDGTDADTLLRRAETAMASARHAHGGPVAWAPAYEVQGQRRLAVVTALRDAISSGEIGLAFQPKLDLTSSRVCGVEALARWSHPALGRVAPDEFIPLAETSGSIGPLTSAVLRQAAAACREWQERAPGVGVSVNVSAQTVLDPNFVSEVAAVLLSAGLAPELLTLELTEGVVVGDPGLAKERLSELRALGARVAVDDFGTGYSSLTYLKGLPVDEVKIDKGFVAGLGVDPADAAVVRAVVGIAHTLGLRVVAEGVENVGQLESLRSLSVDEVQGYLHGPPMPAEAFSTWMQEHKASYTQP